MGSVGGMLILYVTGAIVVVILLALTSIVTAYKKVPPNQAMIVYGLGGKRVVQRRWDVRHPRLPEQ